MSTQIYNGLILRNASLEQALGRLKAIRNHCCDSAIMATASSVAGRVQIIRDLRANASLLGDDRKYSPEIIVERDFYLAKAEVKSRNIRRTDWDFTFDVLLIPKGSDVLALSYFESDVGYDVALTTAGFMDYHYQDASDQPDEISDDEWLCRKEAWESALPGNVAPVEVGLTFSLVTWEDQARAFWDRKYNGEVELDESARRLHVAMTLTELEYSYGNGGMSTYQAAKQIRELAKVRSVEVLLA